MNITIKITNLNGVLKDIADIEKWLDKKANELCKRLADIGMEEARVRFANAIYDKQFDGSSEPNNVKVSVEPRENGYSVVADGDEVCFIEFGAGVSQASEYLGNRPDGVVGIGEYGKGKGKNGEWFTNKIDKMVIVRNNDGTEKILKGSFVVGTPTSAPLYNASEKVLEQLTDIAREVFK